MTCQFQCYILWCNKYLLVGEILQTIIHYENLYFNNWLKNVVGQQQYQSHCKIYNDKAKRKACKIDRSIPIRIRKFKVGVAEKIIY